MSPTNPTHRAGYELAFGDFGGTQATEAAPTAAPTAAPVRSRSAAGEGLEDVKKRVHSRMIDLISAERVSQLPESDRRGELGRLIGPIIDTEAIVLSGNERQELIEVILNESLGFGPLDPLLRDSSISDILVNGPHQIYIERHGVLSESSVQFRDEQHLEEIIRRIAAQVGRRVDESSPIVDARMADGSRINAVLPPLAVRGAALSIRRFGKGPLRLADLLAHGAMTPAMARVLEAAVKAKQNVIISGGTGSGKTTLLNALTGSIQDTDRIITIEDTAELRIQKRHVVTLESRAANIDGRGEISMRELLRATLRMRPNRIIVGECRGPEALDMLQAMNTGHSGSMTTLHANGPRDALARLELMILLSGMTLPLSALRELIGAAVDIVIQVDRQPGGGRRVTSISEVAGVSDGVVLMQELFNYKATEVDSQGRSTGQFESTGIRPHFLEEAKAAGIDLPSELFQRGIVRG
jgi:pilus assembly protein CpaF